MPEVSIDEFFSKRKLSAQDGILYRAAKIPKSFNSESRSARVVMTDETVDSYGDIIKAGGADMDRFSSNPIALLNHRSDMIIGTWGDVEKRRKSIEGTVTIAAEGTAPHIDMCFNLMSQGILRAASVGLIPTKVERRLDDDGEPMWSYIIHEWELFECSIVAIPANPSALAKSIKDGNTLARDLLEEVLDTYIKTPAGVIVPREEYEDAHRDAGGNKTSVITTKIELDDGASAELKNFVERVEAAVEKIAGSDKIAIDEADAIKVDLEKTLTGAIDEFIPKVDAIKEPERKGALTKLMDGIRAVFAESEPEPEKVDQETKDALRKRAEDIAARHAEAA